jgi:hypothetical protein
VSLSSAEILIIYNDIDIVFNSTEYDGRNEGRLLQSSSIGQSLSSLPAKLWPYFAIWTTDTASASSSPLQLNVQKFSVSQTSGDSVPL